MANRKPLQYPRYQAWADDETFLNGGTITFYDAGTTNKRNVYQDAALTTTAPNPVTLNSRGEPQSAGGTAIDIYLDDQPYKIVSKDSSGTTVHTIDNYIEPPATQLNQPETLSDLQGLNTSTFNNDAVVYLRGRSSAGDGGEGHFRWDSSNLSTEVGNDEVTTNEGDGGIYVAPASDKTGAGGAWVRQDVTSINVLWYGAKGDGSTDDASAIQAAIDASADGLSRRVVLPRTSSSYIFKSTLTIATPIVFEGLGTAPINLIGDSFGVGEYLIDVDGSVNPNLENVTLKGITLREQNSAGDTTAIRNNKCSFFSMIDVIIRNITNGIEITGDRTFSTYYERVHIAKVITGNAIIFPSFSGGGQHTFISCTFGGKNGVNVQSDSDLQAVLFSSCNFEGCSTSGMTVNGTLRGVTFNGCRAEKCAGTATFRFRPAAGKNVTGISFNGGNFETDSETYGIEIGGGSGFVRGFFIQGAWVEGYSTSFVRLNGDGHAGTITGNYLDTAGGFSVINTLREGVLVYNNEDQNGRIDPTLDEEWGSWTPADNSGASLTFTATNGAYTKKGRLIFWQMQVIYPSTADTNDAEITLPSFAVDEGPSGSTSAGRSGASISLSSVATQALQFDSSGTAVLRPYNSSAARVTNADLSGTNVYASGFFVETP